MARAATDSLRQAMAKLRMELDRARDIIDNPEAYVATIARCRFKCPTIDLSEKQIWMLIFDIWRNASRRRSKRAGDCGKSKVEIRTDDPFNIQPPTSNSPEVMQ